MLPADLVEGMWAVLGPSMNEWRAMGVYGPAVDVPANAPLQDRLLGLSGRLPSSETSRARPGHRFLDDPFIAVLHSGASDCWAAMRAYGQCGSRFRRSLIRGRKH